MIDKRDTPDMFSAIAGRYDALNHILSFNVDRGWRRKLVRAARVSPGAAVLDVATGTGDVAVDFATRTGAGRIVGIDRADAMLGVAHRKLERLGFGTRVDLVYADALQLPFVDDTFETVTAAFCLRNFPDYAAAVREMARVLKPGGKLAILEFAPDTGGLFLRAYRFYLRTVLPVVGRIVSGSPVAYEYLASSITGFLSREEVCDVIRSAGLAADRPSRISGGISYIYTGVKPR